LIGGVLDTQLPGRKALILRLGKIFDEINPKLKDILGKANFVSATANEWKLATRDSSA